MEGLLGLIGQVLDLAAALFRWLFRRPSVSVEIRSEIHNDKAGNIETVLTADVENLGASPTSIVRVCEVTGVTPKREILKVQLELDGDDRYLESHRNRLLVFRGRVDARYVFTWYRAYRFRLSRGRTRMVFMRNQNHEKLTYWEWASGRVRMWWQRKKPNPYQLKP